MTNLAEQKQSTFNLLDALNFDSSKIAENEELERKIKEEADFEKYKKSGVPEKFFETSLDMYIVKTEEERKNLETVREFARNPQNRILVLAGNNGNGKSMLSCGALRECGGEYVTSSQLCIEYEAAISYHSKRTREEILAHCSKVRPLFVIDECGKYTINPKLEQFILSYVLCTRYENNLASLVVTNGNKKDFLEFLGKSMFDRLTESCTTLDFTGESKRKSLRSLRNVG